MSKKVTLVYPCPDEIKEFRFGYSLLLLYIAADLKTKGYEIQLLDYSVIPYRRAEFLNLILGSEVVVFEIDAFPLKRASNICNAEALAKDIKIVYNSMPLIAVGKQCTLFHKALEFVDFTVLGDSELYISHIIGEIDSGSATKKLYDAGLLSDMSDLPFPAYEILSNEQIRGKTIMRDMKLAPSALLETSRGCPGQCTFCQRKGWGNGLLTIPVEKVCMNFFHLLNSGIRNIWIVDENFAGNLPRAKKILREFAKIRNGECVKICMSSWVHIDDEFLDIAKSAGVSIISFGIESLLEANQVFYNKRFNRKTTLEMIEYADSLGIFTVGNFIIGSPYDTLETIEEDIRFSISSKLDEINVKILDYMMGSELYERLPLEKKGALHFFSCKECGVTGLTIEDLRNMQSKFQKSFKEARMPAFLKKTQKFGLPYVKEKT